MTDSILFLWLNEFLKVHRSLPGKVVREKASPSRRQGQRGIRQRTLESTSQPEYSSMMEDEAGGVGGAAEEAPGRH